jgi:hypothetical protein
MTDIMKTATIYIPAAADGNEHWAIVAAALRSAGARDIRPAPMQSQTFRLRHARQVVVSSVEI